jgi:cbb3-type cytochrome oxidase subunit 3
MGGDGIDQRLFFFFFFFFCAKMGVSLFSRFFCFLCGVCFVFSKKKKKRKRKKNPTKDERKREGEIDLKNAKKSQKVHSRTFCFSSLHF